MDRQDQRLGAGRDARLSAPGRAGEILPAFPGERTKADGIVPEHPLFVAIETLLAEPLTLNDLMITRAMTEIREAVARENAAGASWGLTIC
jgi:hypothetical protein